MGAETFYNKIEGEDSKKAYEQARENAFYAHGHNGYTGSIAEKSGYTMSKKPLEVDADEWIEIVESFNEGERDQKHYSSLKKDFAIYDDKWADALCIPVEGGFIFCGSASC
jgi:hypothetical protein